MPVSTLLTIPTLSTQEIFTCLCAVVILREIMAEPAFIPIPATILRLEILAILWNRNAYRLRAATIYLLLNTTTPASCCVKSLRNPLILLIMGTLTRSRRHFLYQTIEKIYYQFLF
jgi:hypothetical protein